MSHRIRSRHTVWGFVRTLETSLVLPSVIPSEIKHVIFSFFHLALDAWVAAGDNCLISEQNVCLNRKGKCSAFGQQVISSGIAEWDVVIGFESFGGISIGVFRQNIDDSTKIDALPVQETFTYTSGGYGYANKTGALTANKERKRYGKRYRKNDKVTVRLDLESRTLTFVVNNESQGVAYEGLPNGAYRLACCMMFNEQAIVIQRFDLQ